MSLSLRQELSLFFGGLLLVVLSLVVGLNYTNLRNTMEAELKKGFSPRPFQRVAEGERQLLLERARTLADGAAERTRARLDDIPADTSVLAEIVAGLAVRTS